MADYRGRFAPSPTGPLHFGSLVAAVGSYLEARTRGGEWLLRMEDLDRAREQPGAADSIPAMLRAYGFEWDGPVVYQGRRSDLYQTALEKLRQAGHTFPCSCSRKEIADSTQTFAAAGDGRDLIYPGTCRNGLAPGKVARAVRVKTGGTAIEFEDAVQGRIRQDIAHEVGDFVLKRADSFFAYQLAVVVDDAEQGITDVVRGADLLDSTPRQIYLQQLLGCATPRYVHLPAAVNAAGEKLSKQTLAAPLEADEAAPQLLKALAFLGHDAPATLAGGDVKNIWQWAQEHWSLARVPRLRASPIKN